MNKNSHMKCYHLWLVYPYKSFVCLRIMNDVGYDQLLKPNLSLKLRLCVEVTIENIFSKIFTTLDKDFITSHCLSQSPIILRVDDP